MVKTPGFDCANFCCIGAALGAGKLFGLDVDRLAECLSMAVVPNNALNQARTGHLSMWKAVAAGQSGRAGVFAALLAQAGMRGPHMPFEGKNGWTDHVARHPVSLDTFGGPGVPFKIHDTLIKPRASCATTISSIDCCPSLAVVCMCKSPLMSVSSTSLGNFPVAAQLNSCRASRISGGNSGSPSAACVKRHSADRNSREGDRGVRSARAQARSVG